MKQNLTLREQIVASFGRQIVRLILRNNLGMEKEYCEFVPEEQIELANRTPEKGMTYYYYDGPKDKKNRPFCHDMLDFDKVFSEDEIDFLSAKLGYNVLQYKGSYGCRHEWIRFRGKVIYTPPPTPNQKRVLTTKGQPYNDGIKNPKGYTNYK